MFQAFNVARAWLPTVVVFGGVWLLLYHRRRVGWPVWPAGVASAALAVVPVAAELVSACWQVGPDAPAFRALVWAITGSQLAFPVVLAVAAMAGRRSEACDAR